MGHLAVARRCWREHWQERVGQPLSTFARACCKTNGSESQTSWSQRKQPQSSSYTPRLQTDIAAYTHRLFSLARKLQPAIIFIDEIDAFLRERASSDHEVSSMLKAEFMSCWDGLLTEGDRIMVLGATNRPTDIDAAILRRFVLFPLRCHPNPSPVSD